MVRSKPSFFFFLARPQLLYRHRGPHQKASRFCLVGQRPWKWDKDKRTFESWMTQLLKKKIAFSPVRSKTSQFCVFSKDFSIFVHKIKNAYN